MRDANAPVVHDEGSFKDTALERIASDEHKNEIHGASLVAMGLRLS